MKLRSIIWCGVVVLALIRNASGQGFVNLDFVDALTVPDPWCANATDESGLIGDWWTADYSSWYNFGKDHSVTKRWDPKDHSVTETYSNIVPFAWMTGHWKLDGNQLVIKMDSEFVPESSGKVTTVHLSGTQGTASWTIVSDSRWTMTWSTTTSDNFVSRNVELKLRRMDGPLIAIN